MKKALRYSVFGLALLASYVASPAAAVTPAGPQARGSVTTDKAQQFVGISLKIPTGFEKKEETKEPLRSPIPSAPPTTETFRSYMNSANQGIYFFHWDGTPFRDRGPMQAAESWETPIDGTTAKVSLTSQFFGRPKQVLVAHFSPPAPSEHRYMIYTTLIDKAAFAALLSSIRFDSGAASIVPNITITFRQVPGSDAIKAYATEKIAKLQKLLNHAMTVQVTISLERAAHVTDMKVWSGGWPFHVTERGADVYGSIDSAVDKLDRQIRLKARR